MGSNCDRTLALGREREVDAWCKVDFKLFLALQRRNAATLVLHVRSALSRTFLVTLIIIINELSARTPTLRLPRQGKVRYGNVG